MIKAYKLKCFTGHKKRRHDSCLTLTNYVRIHHSSIYKVILGK